MSFANEVGNHQLNPAIAQGALAAGQSFILGYAVNTLLSNLDFATGLVGGALSAVASIVDSFTRPIIVNSFIRPMIAGMFELSFHNSLLELLTRTIVVLTVIAPLAVVVAPLMGMTQAFDVATMLFLRLFSGMVFGARTWDHYLYVI